MMLTIAGLHLYMCGVRVCVHVCVPVSVCTRRSSKPHHMAQSLDILNFSLSEDEISQIQALDGTFKGG